MKNEKEPWQEPKITVLEVKVETQQPRPPES